MLELRERNEKKRERLKIKHERRELVQSPYLQTVLILQPTNNDDDDNNGNKRYCYSFVWLRSPLYLLFWWSLCARNNNEYSCVVVVVACILLVYVTRLLSCFCVACLRVISETGRLGTINMSTNNDDEIRRTTKNTNSKTTRCSRTNKRFHLRLFAEFERVKWKRKRACCVYLTLAGNMTTTTTTKTRTTKNSRKLRVVSADLCI